MVSGRDNVLVMYSCIIITPNTVLLNNKHIVPDSQETWSGLARWFWLMVSHKVAVIMWARSAVIWGLDWGRIDFQGCSLTWFLAGGLSSLPWRYHSRKDPDAGKDWGQEEKGTAEDEMVGWHHRLNGREFEQPLGDSEGQGRLACCSPWGCKESDATEWLNNTHNMAAKSVPEWGI